MARYENLNVRELVSPTGKPGAPVIPSYLLATVPDAALYTGQMIIITDATPAALCWSDGTNWIATDDGTTAA